MATLNICKRTLVGLAFRKNGQILCRSIATSTQKKANEECSSSDKYRKIPDFSKPLENKNWVSYGYDTENFVQDRVRAHIILFSCVTMVFCGYIFIYIYYPDRGRKDWFQREAFIRLYEREQLGLEPIDPNYVDPSKIVLPPDEELGDDEIIV